MRFFGVARLPNLFRVSEFVDDLIGLVRTSKSSRLMTQWFYATSSKPFGLLLNKMVTVAKMKKKPAKTPENKPLDYDAIIVGTGFGGMGAAIQLRRLGIDAILMLDREDDLGGTWHVNTYPGLAVDIASFTYSYSFEPNPNWTRLYARGPELKRYAEHVADKYDLRKHMRFNSVVSAARYDEIEGCWTVTLAGQEPIRTRLLILATGFLSQAHTPDIPGINDFSGKIIHTAEWDSHYDLSGKRAAVIGTGATAVQLIPQIAKKLAQLDVYQRTAIWVTPKVDGNIPKSVRKLFSVAPLLQKGARIVSSGILEVVMVAGALYNKQLPVLTSTMERVCKAHMARAIKDPALRKKLTPSYSFGCKRPTFSNNYYPTFTRDNVELVSDGIARIEKDGIVDNNGEKRKIDTLILATGFDLWEKNFPAIEIIGKNGQSLGALWRKDKFKSYQGISMPGFPNLFSLTSPYAYNGLSYFSTIEGQMKHMARCIAEMRRQNASIFEVTETAMNEFVDEMKSLVENSVFVQGACASSNSYYFNQHGEATLLRPTSTLSGLWTQGHFPLDAYRFS